MILLIFTLIFSGILSLFTNAKRHEILGSAAAYVAASNLWYERCLIGDENRYCAVLVVFIGNVGKLN